MRSARPQPTHLPQAVWHFERAIRFAPGNALYRFDYDVAFAKQSQFPEAPTQIEVAIRLKPDFAETHDLLGGLSENAGAVEKPILLEPVSVTRPAGAADQRRRPRQAWARPPVLEKTNPILRPCKIKPFGCGSESRVCDPIEANVAEPAPRAGLAYRKLQNKPNPPAATTCRSAGAPHQTNPRRRAIRKNEARKPI
jgi:hypothetical protein